MEATQASINDYNNQIEITISWEYIKKAKVLNQKYLTQLAVINKAGLTAPELFRNPITLLSVEPSLWRGILAFYLFLLAELRGK